jgi:2,4-diketo-3-deoxy-L-fuconate hydrolase
MNMDSSPLFAIGSFSIAGSDAFAGMVRDDQVIALTALDAALQNRSVLDLLEQWDANLPRLQRAAQRWADGDRGLVALATPVTQLKVEAPLRPRQIFAIGANYRKHVIEIVMADPNMQFGEMATAADEASRRIAVERMMDERAANAQPYAFSKLPSALAGPFDALPIPAGAEKIDWECEIAVIIGRPARQVAAAEASAHIAGYAIANDVTARDLVFRRDIKIMGTDWVSAKSQPGFLPFGPYLVPAAFVDPTDLRIQLSVNDRVMQDEHSSDMLISIDRQIAYLSSRVQLLPGDVICTGSPAGNGSHHGVFLKPGDEMIAKITGLGEQRVTCRRAFQPDLD